jgi:hypothetical protein
MLTKKNSNVDLGRKLGSSVMEDKEFKLKDFLSTLSCEKVEEMQTLIGFAFVYIGDRCRLTRRTHVIWVMNFDN